MEFAHSVVDGGADLFLGHHPHVTYGIDVRDGRYIVPSLGNFVFHQAARYWTQWSFGFAACIRKDTLGTRVSSFHAIPVAAGAQPRFVPDGPDAEKMLTRIRVWSSREVAEHMPW
jgi:poly-gamma-glutamate synthesis protein (capsule biosynthesis protein)